MNRAPGVVARRPRGRISQIALRGGLLRGGLRAPTRPSSASPTTSKPSDSRIARADARKLGWSSTISTVKATVPGVAEWETGSSTVSRTLGGEHVFLAIYEIRKGLVSLVK